jgi:hypothetical protein
MILILGIIVAGVSFVYFLAIPIMNKMQDTAMINQVENSMVLLGNNVLTIVNEGNGSQTLTQFSYGKGTLMIYPNFVSETFQMFNTSSSQPQGTYSQTLERIEYSVGTSSDIIPPNSTLYVTGWSWNVVNGTQGEPNSDIDRIVIQRIDSAQVNLLLDFRPSLHYYNDSKGNVYVTINIVKFAVNPFLMSGIGAGTFQISTQNQNTTITSYTYAITSSNTFRISASQAGVTGNVFSCPIIIGKSPHKSVTVNFVVTEVEVGVL